MKLIICRGPSASGKSTYAKELCDSDESFVEINRDFVRFNIVCPGSDWSNYKFTHKRENEVTEICTMQAMDAAANERSIITSDTNLNEKTLRMWTSLAEDLGYEWGIKDFPISYEEAVKRDNLRPNGVGHSVIWQQYLKHYKLMGGKQYEPDPLLPKAVLVDVDGCIALNTSGRGWYAWDEVGKDTPQEHIVDLVNMLHSQGMWIVLLSGRDGSCREITEEWLIENGVSYDYLYMRRAGDMRKDTIIKEEIFWTYIEDQFNVQYVIDDRPCVVRNWIKMGLKVLGVGDQNVEF